MVLPSGEAHWWEVPRRRGLRCSCGVVATACVSGSRFRAKKNIYIYIRVWARHWNLAVNGFCTTRLSRLEHLLLSCNASTRQSALHIWLMAGNSLRRYRLREDEMRSVTAVQCVHCNFFLHPHRLLHSGLALQGVLLTSQRASAAVGTVLLQHSFTSAPCCGSRHKMFPVSALATAKKTV